MFRRLPPVVAAAVFLNTSWLGAENLPSSVSFPWERSWPVVTSAKANAFGFILKNPGTASINGTFSATLTSPSGKEEEVEQTVSIPPGKEKKIPWPLGKKEKGCWVVKYSISPNTGDEVKGAVTFGYLDPTGPNNERPSFAYGIVSHAGGRPEAECLQQMEAAAFVGCKVMRTGQGWEKIQKNGPEEWNWDRMDLMVSTAEKLGMQLQVGLFFTPQWAAPKEARESKNWLDWNRATPDYEAYRTFISTYAKRYKGRIRLWEPWNEPDLEGFYHGTTEEYIEMVKIAIDELHKVDPANLVMSGGFATLTDHPSRFKNPDLQEKTMLALGPKIDLHAVHEHGSFERFAQVVDGPYAELRKKLPAPVPPIFFNETAEHSTGGREKAQAEILVKKSIFARARGAVGYLWYDLKDDGIDPHDAEHHFGLLDFYMQPKPAYIAFNTVAREVIRRPYLKQLDAGENRWFFLHGDDRVKLLAYWNEDDWSQNEQVLLKMPGATRAAMLDINGNFTPWPIYGDMAVVTSSQEPLMLLAEGAKTIEVAGRLAGPPRAFYGAPGADVVVECEFYNPGKVPATIKTEWAVPMLMKMSQAPAKEITVPAGGRGTASVTVKLPEGENYKFGSSGKVLIKYAFAGMPYEGRILIPVHYGTIAVPADTTDRAPDVVLDQPEQLTSFIEADPALTQYRWRGPDDLSAKIWFSVDSEDLIMKVDVTDNKHFQNEGTAGLWKCDSIQSMISIPGQKGSWELGVAETNEGQPLVTLSGVPVGKTDCRDKIRVSVEKKGEGRVYTIRLPRKEFGFDDKVLKDGFPFNLAINDNDGKVRAHALQIAPGIVANKTMDLAPYLVFKEVPAKTP